MRDVLNHRVLLKFLSDNEVADCAVLFDSMFLGSSYESAYENIREIKSDKIKNQPTLWTLSRRVYKTLSEEFQLDNLVFHKLWLVRTTYAQCDETKLPYVPHFDKVRYFKGMIYLSDVSHNDGPIHFGEFSPGVGDIERRRLSLPEDYQSKGLNLVDQKDLAGDLHPVCGRSGDIVLFDTNSPHKAGIVKQGHVRKVLRFDFYVPKRNKNLKIIKKFSKLLGLGG